MKVECKRRIAFAETRPSGTSSATISQHSASQLRSVTGIVRSALGGNSLGVIQLGLLLLIATPVARVALSLVGFVRQADRTYVLITTVVLAILLFSLAGGRL